MNASQTFFRAVDEERERPVLLGYEAVFTSAYDIVEAVGILLFSGPDNTDEDFERYIRTFTAWDAKATGRDVPLVILIVERGNPPPNAKWRKRISEATSTIQSRPLLILVTESPVIRGVMRALNWLRPMPLEAAHVATIDDARTLAERRRGRPIKSLMSLIAEARGAASTDRPRISERRPGG